MNSTVRIALAAVVAAVLGAGAVASLLLGAGAAHAAPCASCVAFDPQPDPPRTTIDDRIRIRAFDPQPEPPTSISIGAR